MKTNSVFIILFSIILFSLVSCKRFIDVDAPIDKIENDTVFNSPKLAEAAVTGMYDRMTNVYTDYFGGFIFTLITALSADEVIKATTSASSANYEQFYKSEVSTSSVILATNIWRYGYQYIYHANSCVEGLTKAEHLPVPLKNQLLGESYFFRAFCFFYLYNFFGEVPLTLSTDYRITSMQGRAPVKDVQQQIIDDLLNAYGLLSENYPTPGKFRPNKYTAAALLARMYLYSKDYEKANLYATAVIESGSYKLLTDPSLIYAAGNEEALWQMEPAFVLPVRDAQTFIPASTTSIPPYPLTNSLLGVIDAADIRKDAWLKKNIRSGVEYFYPYKFKVRLAPSGLTEYVTPFRLAEQYLIRSESRSHLGDINGALADIDTVRSRANISLLSITHPDISAPQLLDSIINERRIEYMFEWGHRWFDLKRTGKVNDVMSIEKPGLWDAKDTLYPIPQAERLLNNKLTQNAGYNN